MKTNYAKPALGIKNWAEEDRPREKMILRGKTNLTDAELLAIIIGSGTQSISAVDLAKLILMKNDNNLNNLARLSIKDLMNFKGIGEAKAINIVSAMELGRRRKEQDPDKKVLITCSADIYELMKTEMLDLNTEQFWIVLLNRRNGVIRKYRISVGGVSGTVADPKIIFKKGLEHLASSIILIHNHPSGNIKPSQSDLHLTQKLKKAGEFLEMPILDHIIFTDNGYFSFADENLL